MDNCINHSKIVTLSGVKHTTLTEDKITILDSMASLAFLDNYYQTMLSSDDWICVWSLEQLSKQRDILVKPNESGKNEMGKISSSVTVNTSWIFRQKYLQICYLMLSWSNDQADSWKL